jgi:hypothetical protein
VSAKGDAEAAGLARAGETEAPPKRSWARRALRPFALVAGLGIAAFVLRQVGLESVLRVLRQAGLWLPLVALLEVGFVMTDLLALRLLLGDRAGRLTARRWVRSSALAYASTILLPTGRAAGEASRAAVLSDELGVPFAASTCARLQAVFLVGNGGISLLIAAVLFAWRPDQTTPLALAMLGNAATCVLIGSVVLALLRGHRVSAWIDRYVPWVARRFKPRTQADEQDKPPASWRLASGMALCLCGRLVQTVQFAVVMHAVGGASTVPSAMTAQAVQIVGATAGDIFPAQVGASEGSYYACAAMLGFAADPARALSIRILVLTAELGLAVACLLVAAIVGRGRRGAGASKGA